MFLTAFWRQPVDERKIFVDDASEMFSSVYIVRANRDPQLRWRDVLGVSLAHFPQHWRRSVKHVGRKQDPRSVGKLRTQRGSNQKNVNRFLLRRVEEIVLNSTSR